MTTDKEKFLTLITEFGLKPDVSVLDGAFNSVEGTTEITFEKPQPKVVGYSASLAVFIFNPDGSFKEIGVWE